MSRDDMRTESQASATGRFPNRDARRDFLRQVQLWNSVEGMPVVLAESLDDVERVRIRTVVSAKRAIVRLIEAFGGFVEDDAPQPADSTDVGRDHTSILLA
jgi:hypothetical protein